MCFDGRESVSVDNLAIGTTCPCDLCDEHGVLLIASGVKITVTLIDKLRSHGVTSLHKAGATSGDGHSPPAAPAGRNTRRRTPSLEDLSTSYDAERVRRVRKQFYAGERAIVQLTAAFNRNHVTNLQDTDPHIDNYIKELADDPDPIVANALKYESDLQLAHRCVQFSILSLAIAQRMNLAADEMRDIGSAALIHDWGLFALPPESRFPHQNLDDATRAKYVRHPIVVEEMLDSVEGVNPTVKLIVTQVHELLDGTGFPNRLKASEIPLYSRVLAVADAYLTMTCPPRGCARIVPCDAIAYMITAASQGQYAASAVTGLLKAVTLYPIGSIVELSDTTKARVIRSNGNDYGYPIVETLSLPIHVVNLKESDLFVTRPVTSVENHEVRLPDTYTELSQTLGTCQTQVEIAP